MEASDDFKPKPYSDEEIKNRTVLFAQLIDPKITVNLPPWMGTDEDYGRLLATIAADRRKMAMCHKRIEELSEDLVKEECEDWEKCPTFYDGCNCKGANKYHVENFKLGHTITDQAATIERLRGALEKAKEKIKNVIKKPPVGPTTPIALANVIVIIMNIVDEALDEEKEE